MKNGPLFRFVTLATLHVLAAPMFLFILGLRVARAIRTHRHLRDGVVRCSSCGEENATDALAQCRRCNTVEFGSRLFCSRCGLVSSDIPCEACGASIRVL